MHMFASAAVTVIVAVTALSAFHQQPRGSDGTPRVTLLRLPEDGIQPQAAVDEHGIAHVVFFKGEPGAGDLYYSRLDLGRQQFSTPVRVNSIDGSAIATGSVRGAQVAVGRNGRLHVAWNGSKTMAARDGSTRHPMAYSRSKADGSGFEPQRDLLTWTTGLDGGGSVTADRTGNVYVAWHGRGEQQGEANRTVYVTHSRDDGATFAREERAVAAEIGACACCGMRGITDASGTLHLIYRAATDGVQRDATWIAWTASEKLNSELVPLRLHAWRLSQCPMSMFALTRDGDNIMAAWETNQQIFVATLDPKQKTFSPPVSMTGDAPRRLPSIAVNGRGDRVVAWTEGTAWARGGSVAWQLYDRQARQLEARSAAATVSVWSLVAAIARPDGSFLIIH